jgi:hypothetical protein
MTAIIAFMTFASIAQCAEDAAIRPTMIIVTGASGAPQFESTFADWANRWVSGASKAGLNVVTIGLSPEDPMQSDYERLHASLEEAAKTPAVDLWLVLIGHGTFDRRDAKFNLRGPDVSAQELAGWLKQVDRPMAIIDTSAASAPFLTALSSPKRVVIAATKSGAEQNFAHFGDFMSQSIADPAADLDKDDQTSLWEAYLLASRRTAEFYSTDGRLQTEHPLLDDTGDGKGVRADQFRGLTAIEKTADGKPLDGQRAHQWHLVRNSVDSALPPSVLQKRDALELSVIQLRDRKATIPDIAYRRELERLLIELAELNESAGQ